MICVACTGLLGLPDAVWGAASLALGTRAEAAPAEAAAAGRGFGFGLSTEARAAAMAAARLQLGLLDPAAAPAAGLLLALLPTVALLGLCLLGGSTSGAAAGMV